jgi:hypothetical protein
MAGPQYGIALGALGNFYDPPSGAVDSGRLDFAASGFNTNDLFVVPGELAVITDRGFSAPERRVIGTGNVGQSIASSYQPAFGGVVGDLDGDGQPELCAGTRLNDRVVLFYKDVFATAALTPPTTPTSAGILFPLSSTTPDSEDLIVQFVGDINGDGHLDLAVGDPHASGNQGQVILLY